MGAAVLLILILSVRVIRTDNDTIVASKPALSFKDTYADTRSWKASDYLKHSDVTRELLERKGEKIARDVQERIRMMVKKAEQKR